MAGGTHGGLAAVESSGYPLEINSKRGNQAMCKTSVPACLGCDLEPLITPICPRCQRVWGGALCEGCGRPIAYGGRGRPPVYCQPPNGERWSVCMEAAAIYSRLMVLLPKVAARGKVRFADPGWLMILANQSRDYSCQPRIPRGQENAGRYMRVNGSKRDLGQSRETS